MADSAVVYARYSTDRQDARSLDDQERRCREHAQRQGLNVVHVYSDAAMSESHTQRPGFQALLADARATHGRSFKVVIVDDLARLSRDLWDMGRIVFQDLPALNVRVFDVMTGRFSDDPSSRQLFAAMGMGNDQFLELVKAETHRGLAGRAQQGFWTGGRVYGFGTIPEPNPPDPTHPRKVPVINQEQAEIVRRIFRLYAAGHGHKSIAVDGGGFPEEFDGRGRGWASKPGWPTPSPSVALSASVSAFVAAWGSPSASRTRLRCPACGNAG